MNSGRGLKFSSKVMEIPGERIWHFEGVASILVFLKGTIWG